VPALRSLRAALARLNTGVFDLPAAELVAVNRWLAFTRVLTVVLLIAFSVAMKLALLPDLRLAWVLGPCLAELTLAALYRRWLATGRALGLLIYTQFAVDIVLVTVALAGMPEVPPQFHFLYLLMIVPCSLFSPLCGLVMVALASAAHVVLAVRATGDAGMLDLVAPVFLFLLVANQSRFYSRRLAEKNREAQDAAVVAASLLGVARALATEPTSGSVLQRLTELARELVGARWSCVVARDAGGGRIRIMGLASRTGLLDEEIKSVEFPPAVFERVLAIGGEDGCVAVRSADESPLPRGLHERWAIGPFLVGVLQRAGAPFGLLLVGQDDLESAFRPVARRLVAGMADQAVLALENARLLDELRAASTLKSEFIGTMSHELRSPLNAIIGYTDMLREDAGTPGEPPPDERRALLGRVRVHSLQLLEMIEATLDVSRLEAGRLPVQVAAVDLEELVADLRAGIPPHWIRAGVALVWQVRGPLDVAETDAGKLKMIVRNLVHNALKFTEAGRVSVRIELEHEAHGTGDGHAATLSIAVRDTGVGIGAEQMPVVFEMFRQGDGSDSRRHGGVGLGLYIVRRLVHALGGTVQVESAAGKGSCFTVTVPVRLASARHALAAHG